MIYYNFCPKLKMWYRESFNELNIIKDLDHSFAIFPKRFYMNVKIQDKIYDFIFVGGLLTDKETYKNRKWILPFIEQYFNKRSYLQFTDKKTKLNYKPKGIYDYTLVHQGFVPKEVPQHTRNYFDKQYFDNLSRSQFCLCPAGDVMYSMRFYESIMCQCIPIVNTVEESFRSKAESQLDYKYYLVSDKEFIFRKDWVEHNYQIFLKHHTLHTIENDI